MLMVQQVGKSLHLIWDEVVRWRKILDEPYGEYLLSRSILLCYFMFKLTDTMLIFFELRTGCFVCSLNSLCYRFR